MHIHTYGLVRRASTEAKGGPRGTPRKHGQPFKLNGGSGSEDQREENDSTSETNRAGVCLAPMNCISKKLAAVMAWYK